MIDVIINSYNEPKATLRAVEVFLKSSRKDLRVIVVDPFSEVEKFLRSEIKDKRFNFFLDPGEGKSYSLNLIFQEFGGSQEDIFILTDGDVYVSENVIDEFVNAFEDKKIGVVTAQPVPIDDRAEKFGYWSHFLLAGIDKVRRRLSAQKKFMECSGYLFAIRKGVIYDFPMETSEDSIIPFLFWKKDFGVKYVPSVKVYVKNPSTWDDWVNQKSRNIKAHENLNKIESDMPRTKSFLKEVREGLSFLFVYPKSLKEFFWTVQLYFARLHVYHKAFSDLRKKETYADGWRENDIASTRTLD